MKYCSNCGQKIEDGAHFCPNCGQRVMDNKSLFAVESGPADRRSMKIWCTVFAILGIFSIVMALTDDYSMMSMAAFCLPLAGMFYVLSKTPKRSKYLFGATSGIGKGLFVTFCIVLSFILFTVLTDEYEVSAMIQNLKMK